MRQDIDFLGELIAAGLETGEAQVSDAPIRGVPAVATVNAAAVGENTASGPTVTRPSPPAVHSPTFRPENRAIVVVIRHWERRPVANTFVRKFSPTRVLTASLGNECGD